MGDHPPPAYTDTPAAALHTTPTQPSAAPVVYQHSTATSRTYPQYKHATAKWVGIALVVLGAILIVLQIGAFAVGAAARGSGAGAAFIGGVLTIIAGCFCIAASKQPTQCYVVASMVLAIIAAVFVSGVASSNIAGVIWDADSENCEEDNYWDKECGPFADKIVVGALLIVAGTIDMVITIWAAVLGCKVCCCGRTTVDPVAQQQVIITSHQTGGVVQPGYYPQQHMQAGAPHSYPAQGPSSPQVVQAPGQEALYPTKQ